jgi:hypothetical protein
MSLVPENSKKLSTSIVLMKSAINPELGLIAHFLPCSDLFRLTRYNFKEFGIKRYFPGSLLDQSI